MRFDVPKFIALAALLGMMLHAGAAEAQGGVQGDVQGDAQAGRQKALQCQTCHGLDGIAKLPDAPNLAGQNPVYLVKALQDFRSGARQNEMMSLVAAKLSDTDIADLATYYSSIKITVSVPK